ncbi:MAG: hypothetical protein Q7J54_01565 [Candidatus Woesearchaeota archaeon]|nr:hypothetical protein [Candidatus Woesearchaeota archaeon]
MANQDVVDYVKKQLKKGSPIERIKKALLTAGYPKNAVDEITGSIKPIEKPETKMTNFKSLFVILMVIIFIIMAFILVLKLMEKTPETSNVQTEDFSIRDQALVKNNPALCEEIKNANMRKDCFALISVQSKQNHCDLLENESEQEFCLRTYAAKTNNLELCNDIADSRLRNSCMYDVAINTTNIELCKQLQSDEENKADSCIYMLAKKTKDAAICMEITSPQLKERCLGEMP